MKFQYPSQQTVTISGSPVVFSGDNPLTLFSGALATDFPVDLVDVAAYQSLDIAVSGTPTVVITLSVSWYADAAGLILLATDSLTWSGPGFAQLIVKGSYVTVEVLTLVGSVDMNVVASYRQLATERYQNPQPQTSGGSVPYADGSQYEFNAAVGPGVTFSSEIPSRNGRAQLIVGAPAAFQVVILDALIGGDMIAGVLTPAVTSERITVPFTAPKIALSITILNTDSASHTPTVSVVFAD